VPEPGGLAVVEPDVVELVVAPLDPPAVVWVVVVPGGAAVPVPAASALGQNQPTARTAPMTMLQTRIFSLSLSPYRQNLCIARAVC
jgi:hypothetical protein